jgi:hypothetical protein
VIKARSKDETFVGKCLSVTQLHSVLGWVYLGYSGVTFDLGPGVNLSRNCARLKLEFWDVGVAN